MDCKCNLDNGNLDCIHLEDDNKSEEEKQDMGIHNNLYSLSNNDVDTIQKPNGWLTDAVIAASQILLLQHFLSINRLQPPSLQQVRGFHASENEFVQIINETKFCLTFRLVCSDLHQKQVYTQSLV